jgi:hypothetical protein
VAVGVKQRDGLSVERDKGPAAEPAALVGDNAIGKIAAGVEHRKSGLRATATGGDVGGGKQTADGIGDGRGRRAVAAGQNPDELAQGHGWDRDQFRPREFGLGARAVRRVVVGECTDENVRVGGNFDRFPAQPAAMMSFICSIDRDRAPGCFSRPNTSKIWPPGRAARTSIRPSGQVSTSILSPGRTPRWARRSLRSVT